MKPHVICHMLAPLDGRLLVDPWAPDGSSTNKDLLEHYQRLHADFEADAWLAGTTTMKEFATGTKKADDASPEAPPRPWHVADETADKFAIAIDRHAELHWDSATADDGHVVVVFPSSVPDAHLRELQATGVSYYVLPGEDVDLAHVLDAIGSKLGIRTLLLEGGGHMNGAFLKAGVVDEISLLLWPAIDGKTGGSSIFEAGDESLGQKLRLSLIDAKPFPSGAVHLRYNVEPSSER